MRRPAGTEANVLLGGLALAEVDDGETKRKLCSAAMATIEHRRCLSGGRVSANCRREVA